MLFISESTLQNTLIVAQRAEFGKHTRDWGALTPGKPVWFQTTENILTFGHLLCPTLEPLVLHFNHLLRSPQLIVRHLKQTENCDKFTLNCPTLIFMTLVQGLTDKAIMCLWASSVSHFEPRGLGLLQHSPQPHVQNWFWCFPK